MTESVKLPAGMKFSSGLPLVLPMKRCCARRLPSPRFHPRTGDGLYPFGRRCAAQSLVCRVCNLPVPAPSGLLGSFVGEFFPLIRACEPKGLAEWIGTRQIRKSPTRFGLKMQLGSFVVHSRTVAQPQCGFKSRKGRQPYRLCGLSLVARFIL